MLTAFYERKTKKPPQQGGATRAQGATNQVSRIGKNIIPISTKPSISKLKVGLSVTAFDLPGGIQPLSNAHVEARFRVLGDDPLVALDASSPIEIEKIGVPKCSGKPRVVVDHVMIIRPGIPNREKTFQESNSLGERNAEQKLSIGDNHIEQIMRIFDADPLGMEEFCHKHVPSRARKRLKWGASIRRRLPILMFSLVPVHNRDGAIWRHENHRALAFFLDLSIPLKLLDGRKAGLWYLRTSYEPFYTVVSLQKFAIGEYEGKLGVWMIDEEGNSWPEDFDEDQFICPVPAPIDLSAMVAQITDENRHDEVDFGAPVGKEFGA